MRIGLRIKEIKLHPLKMRRSKMMDQVQRLRKARSKCRSLMRAFKYFVD